MGDDTDDNGHVFPPSREEFFIFVNFTPFVSIPRKQELNTNNGDPSCCGSMGAIGMLFSSSLSETVMLMAILYSLLSLFHYW